VVKGVGDVIPASNINTVLLLPLPVLDGLAVCGPAGRGFRYFPYAVVGIGAKLLALTSTENVCLEISY